jgi:hypothetical protein
MLVAALPAAHAQSNTRPASAATRDEPAVYQEPTQESEAKVESSGGKRFIEAVCWYIPNRIVDLTDIPRLYITLGSGIGGSVRATKWLFNATWYDESAYCLGWSMRKPPFFSEQIRERYFGFLFASAGELDRDPSEVGLGFHFIAIGANAAVSLSEAVDFVLGFIGIDLRADDHGPVLGADYTKKDMKKKAEAPAKSETRTATASVSETAPVTIAKSLPTADR